MQELKELVEKYIDYTKSWSISEDEWYWNIDCTRKSNNINNKEITSDEFDRAIREEILYCFIYNIDSIKNQMEHDLYLGYDEEFFNRESKSMESEIQRLFPTFKIDRF